MERLLWPIPEWRRFEVAAYVGLAVDAPPDDRPEYRFNANVRVEGFRSQRQIDLLATFPSGHRLMVEAQKRSRRIGHGFIDAVEGKLAFVGVDSAHLVSSAGFTNGAVERIRRSNGRLTASHFRAPGDEWTIQNHAALVTQRQDGEDIHIPLEGFTVVDPVTGNVRQLMLRGAHEPTRSLVVAPICMSGQRNLEIRPWLFPPPADLAEVYLDWHDLDGQMHHEPLAFEAEPTAQLG